MNSAISTDGESVEAESPRTQRSRYLFRFVAVLLGLATLYALGLTLASGSVPAAPSVALEQYLGRLFSSASGGMLRRVNADDPSTSSYFVVNECDSTGACLVTFTLPQAHLQTLVPQPGPAGIGLVDVEVEFQMDAMPLWRFGRGDVPETFLGVLTIASNGKIAGYRPGVDRGLRQAVGEMRPIITHGLVVANVATLLVGLALVIYGVGLGRPPGLWFLLLGAVVASLQVSRILVAVPLIFGPLS